VSIRTRRLAQRALSADAHGIEIIATYDTAGSAKMVQDGKLTDTAAIAVRGPATSA
jgi:prephenate dehydratase